MGNCETYCVQCLKKHNEQEKERETLQTLNYLNSDKD